MITIPLKITRKGFERCSDVAKSIDMALSLLLQTPCYGCVADPKYGFVFKNLRFEILNENEGTVYDSRGETTEVMRRIYKRKVSGTSKDSNTFAAALKDAVARYEKRLSNISVSMTYIREERIIYVSVKGIITATGTFYQYNTQIRIWR